MTTALRRCRFTNTSTTFIRSLSRTAVAMTPQARFADGSDEASLTNELNKLTAAGWALTDSGQGIERSFKFKTFAKTWDFMTAVSLQCKLKNHHPEWSNIYNTTFIRWTTHSPPGLSDKDTCLATICDGLAKDFGEIREHTSTKGMDQLKELANQTAATAGGCCVPKK